MWNKEEIVKELKEHFDKKLLVIEENVISTILGKEVLKIEDDTIFIGNVTIYHTKSDKGKKLIDSIKEIYPDNTEDISLEDYNKRLQKNNISPDTILILSTPDNYYLIGKTSKEQKASFYNSKKFPMYYMEFLKENRILCTGENTIEYMRQMVNEIVKDLNILLLQKSTDLLSVIREIREVIPDSIKNVDDIQQLEIIKNHLDCTLNMERYKKDFEKLCK